MIVVSKKIQKTQTHSSEVYSLTIPKVIIDLLGWVKVDKIEFSLAEDGGLLLKKIEE